MAKETTPLPSPERPQSYLVSREVVQLVGNTAVLLNHADKLEAADIIHAILGSETSLGGFATINVLQQSGIDSTEVLRLVSQKAAEIDPSLPLSGMVAVGKSQVEAARSVMSLFSKAKELAVGKPIDTGHLIAADLEQSQSVISSVLSTLQRNDTRVGHVVAGFITELRKKPARQEKGLGETITVQRYEGEAEGIVDLLEKAKEGTYANRVVKRQWLVDTVMSVANYDLTIITSEHDGEAQLLSEALAHQLSLDSDVFPYCSIVSVDQAALAKDTTGTLQDAVQKSVDGILLLPSPIYLENRSVKLGLLEGKMKVVVIATDAQWRQFESNVQTDYTSQVLFLKSPTQKEAEEMFLPMRKVWELHYSTKNLPIIIDEQAIREAIKVGMRYASALGSPIQLAVEKLLSRAVVEVRLAHSALKTLADSRVIADKQIDVADVHIAFHNLTGMEVVVENMERYARMEETLAEDIKGQPEAVATVSEVIRKAKAGMGDPKRPVGSFLFLGPSGVGKSELASSLNRFLNVADSDLIIFDMGTFTEEHMATRFVGAPKGYRDSESGGELTERVKRKPNAVIVFDEVEKAHQKVWDALLGLLDKGTFTDARGIEVDFRNTVIIMTGNIGSRRFDQIKALGYVKVKEQVIADAKGVFRPEFFNRLDEVIVFRTLEKESILAIVDVQVGRFNKVLADSRKSVRITEAVREYLAQDALSEPQYGARPVKRSVERMKNALASWMVSQPLTPGDVVQVDLVEGKLTFTKTK